MAAKQHTIKELYEKGKKLSGKWLTLSKPIKDATVNELTKQDDQPARWAEYFEGLLRHPPPPHDAVITEGQDSLLNVSKAKPCKQEIKRAIKEQKNSKSPGPECSPA